MSVHEAAKSFIQALAKQPLALAMSAVMMLVLMLVHSSVMDLRRQHQESLRQILRLAETILQQCEPKETKR